MPPQTAKTTAPLTIGGSPTKGITRDFFGADCNNSFGSGFKKPVLADGLGNPAVLSTIRFWDNGLKWCQIQSSAGVYNWTQFDKWVQSCQDEGFDIIYVFGAVPTFIASQCSKASGCSNPAGTANTCCPPTDVNSDGSGSDATFKAFVTALINHVGEGVIAYYELWNEQDSGNFFGGNMAQAVRMGQDAAAIIRALDPTATILSPSFHGPTAATFFQSYCTTKVNGIAGYQNFDIVNAHFRASDANQIGQKDANVDPTCFYTPYSLITGTIATLKSQGIDLTNYPLWDDEYGYLPGQGNNGYPPPITDAYMFAAYVAVGLILRASVGLDKACYYSWTNGQPLESLQGNPAGTAWNTIANILIGKSCGPATPNTGYSQGNNKFGNPIYTCPCGSGMFVWDQSKTCSLVNGVEVCNTSQYQYPPQYTKYTDALGNKGSLSGGSVAIGCIPKYLS